MSERKGEFGQAAYNTFCQRIERRTGLRLSWYKHDQMIRRVIAMAGLAKADTFEDFWLHLDGNATEMKKFLGQITVNVTSLMRNPTLFEKLSLDMLPLFGKDLERPLALWSAGCSYGAEAYSLAMILRETFPNTPASVLATDIDRQILAQASTVTFQDADMAEVSLARRGRFFRSDEPGRWRPSDELRRLVVFERHDLLGSSYPVARFDVILCRNVVIYFSDEAKDRVFSNLVRALRPGGLLFIGCSESIKEPKRLRIERVAPCLYRLDDPAVSQAIKSAA